ncbi:MAG: hypothetical protein SGI92_19070 [Bryobacteraceae bacterium]|nr:hypothetical protein [Bryobacteraceae bacterium]
MRTAIKIVLFAVIFKLLDVAAFQGLRRLDSNLPADETGLKLLYAGRRGEEIVAFGDSRIRYHVNTRILNQSTGMSAWNLADAGSNFEQQWFTLNEYLDFNTPPRVIIFEADTLSLDAKSGLKFHTELFRPFQGYSSRAAGLFATSPLEGFAMRIATVRAFKSRIVPLAASLFSPVQAAADNTANGAPLVLVGHHPNGLKASAKRFQISQERKDAFHRLAALATSKSVVLILLTTPEYKHDEQLIPADADTAYGFFSGLANPTAGIYYLNYARDPRFVNNDDMWFDGQHLNVVGMSEFSKVLAKDLATILQNQAGKRKSL